MESSLGLTHTLQRHSTDPLRFRLTMNVVVREALAEDDTTPADHSPNWAYRVAARVMGYFVFEEGTPEDTIRQMIATNGLVMLYGVTRGVVAQVTAVSHWGKFILPSVNFIEYLRVANPTDEDPVATALEPPRPQRAKSKKGRLTSR